MAFTPVEIIALVLLIVAAVKMVVLLISGKSWMNLAKSLYKNKVVFQIICFLLAGVVLYYLLQDLTIVQIFAVTAFVALLLALGMAEPIKKIIPVYEKHLKNKTLFKTYWLYVLVWLALMAWVFIELFL